MEVLLWIVAVIAVLWALAYLRLPLLISTLATTATLALVTLLVPINTVLLYTIWTVFLVAAIPLNIPPLRRLLISNAVLAVFRKILPKMSQTDSSVVDQKTGRHPTTHCRPPGPRARYPTCWA